jgi:hypothetical protein
MKRDITLPEEHARAVERYVDLSRRAQHEAVAAGEEGYRRSPEPSAEAESAARAAAEVLGREDWT